jgi:hypothetical protein
MWKAKEQRRSRQCWLCRLNRMVVNESEQFIAQVNNGNGTGQSEERRRGGMRLARFLDWSGFRVAGGGTADVPIAIVDG